MSKALQEELDEYRTTLVGFRRQYEDDGTIPQDERDYLEAVLEKLQDPALAEPAGVAGFAFEDGNILASPDPAKKKTPFKRTPFRQKTPPPPKPAPVFDKVGRADFLPPVTTGLLLWNFQDNNSTLDGNQQNALKSKFLTTLKESVKSYEIIGYTSGIGLDSAGGAKLAAARARAARELLIKNGVKKEKFVRTIGKAAKSPLKEDMKNGQPWAEGAARNRKVEILPTDNLIVIPDEVVDAGGGRGDVSDSGGRVKDVDVEGKLPEGASDKTEGTLTQSDFAINVVSEAVGSVIGGAVVSGAIGYMQLIDAWKQAQQEANKRGRAYGLKIGAAAAVKLLSMGKEKVTAMELSDLTKGQEQGFAQRAPGIALDEVKREVSIGVEASSFVVNNAIYDIEKQFRNALERKLSIRNADLVFRANIVMVRTKIAEQLARQIAAKVDALINK